MTRRPLIFLFFLLMASLFTPITAYSAGANLFSTKSRAVEFNGLLITMVDILLNYITMPDGIKDKHQVGGSVSHKYLDNGDELVRLNNFHIRIGHSEEYKLSGIFLISVLDETLNIINKTNSTLNFVVEGRDWPVEISQFKHTTRDAYENDVDYQLIAYELSFTNHVTGQVHIKTVEPMRLNYADGASRFSGAKPVSGKLEIIQNSNSATVTILPTPENYTWSIIEIETGNKTYRDEWRYLHPHALRTFPVNY